MIAATQWLRIWVFSVEVPGLNTSIQVHFHAPFLPHNDCCIRVFQPCNLQLFDFCLVTL